MFLLRLLLNLTLVAALAVLCPFRCQAENAWVQADRPSTAAGQCSCCHHLPASDSRTPPVDNDCAGDCVCDGAVDGPRIVAVEIPTLLPAELFAPLERAAHPIGCAQERLAARPTALSGACRRLKLASLII